MIRKTFYILVLAAASFGASTAVALDIPRPTCWPCPR
jgi:hypothetical protein